ncbi:MAG: hypothetical protein ACHQHP_04345, partial [Bacteroidia bacterium]
LIFIVAASLSMWLYLHKSEGTIRKELYEFAVDDTSSINKIYMANMAGKQVTLEKTKPGYWQANGKFKARADAIKNLLVTIKDMRVMQPVAKSALENISKDLATSSTKVEIYQNNKLVKMYYVGADTQDGLGTFMLLSNPETGENSTLPFVVAIPGFNGFLSVRYFLDQETWREKNIFAFYPDQISSISVKFPHQPDSSFTFSLSDANKISLADGKGNNISDFDTLKAKRYIIYFSNIQYESMKNDMRKSLRDSVFSKGPVHIFELKDREGKIHTMKTFTKPPADPNDVDPETGQRVTEDIERMYVLINEDKDIAVIQYFALGKLFHGLSYFEKSSAPKINTAKKK